MRRFQFAFEQMYRKWRYFFVGSWYYNRLPCSTIIILQICWFASRRRRVGFAKIVLRRVRTIDDSLLAHCTSRVRQTVRRPASDRWAPSGDWLRHIRTANTELWRHLRHTAVRDGGADDETRYHLVATDYSRYRMPELTLKRLLG